MAQGRKASSGTPLATGIGSWGQVPTSTSRASDERSAIETRSGRKRLTPRAPLPTVALAGEPSPTGRRSMVRAEGKV